MTWRFVKNHVPSIGHATGHCPFKHRSETMLAMECVLFRVLMFLGSLVRVISLFLSPCPFLQ